MIIDVNQAEFGYELISCVPYAYWLHQHNALELVKSCEDTKCLYYFTDHHQEIYKSRSEYKKPPTPNGNIHVPMLDLRMWSPPLFREYYKNTRFLWDKPTCVICNKYKNDGRNPIGFDKKFLSQLFLKLIPHYTIIYNRPQHKNIAHDESGQIDIGDFGLIENEFPQVIDINHLYMQNSDLSFNTLQMMVLANADHFISCQGGSSILCSYFGGTNIIYAYEGKELDVGSYENWYHLFSGAKIIHSKTIQEVVNYVDDYFIPADV